MDFVNKLVEFLLATNIFVAVFIFVVGRKIERIRPVQRNQPRNDIVLDGIYAVAQQIIFRISAPFWESIAVILVNVAGGGLILLRTDGRWFVVSLVLWLVTVDFLEYLWHRAQHAWKPLWAMHSLHHSEESINVLTAYRAFWLEFWIKIVAVYPIAGILFKAPPTLLFVAAVVHLLGDNWAHLNLRLSLGRFSLYFQNPQFHRIHHSTKLEHLNKNFSALLPIWDVLFGTVWKPLPGEFPDTGLVPREVPANIFEALLWPFRARRLSPGKAEISG
ncbi:MAG: sterol desaturase family protein [Alphaproteobacteria bacterium]